MNEIKVKMNLEDDFRKGYILSKNNSIFPITKLGDIYTFYVSGYIKLKDLENIDEYKAILILEKALIIIENLKDYFFDPSEYIINENTIFLNFKNEEIKDLKLLFINKETNLDENKTILNLIYSLFNKTNDNGKTYLNKIIKELKLYNLDYIKLLKLLNEIKSEILTFKKY